MACNPFEPWGAEDEETPEEELSKEEKEERRYAVTWTRICRWLTEAAKAIIMALQAPSPH